MVAISGWSEIIPAPLTVNVRGVDPEAGSPTAPQALKSTARSKNTEIRVVLFFIIFSFESLFYVP
jgi:hypothetical protein